MAIYFCSADNQRFFRLDHWSYHCSVAINEGTVLLIDGKIGSDNLNLIWAYDFVTDRLTWELPRMNESREDHSCTTYAFEPKWRIRSDGDWGIQY